MGLVEQPPLLCVCLRGQRHHHRQPAGGELRTQLTDKPGVILPLPGGDILKIHVQALIALAGDGLHNLPDELVAEAAVSEDHHRPLTGKMAVLRQGGQMHQRRRPQPPCF